MEATRRSYSLNWRPSPSRRARSIRPLATASEGTDRSSAGRSGGAAAQALHHLARLVALAALLAVPLDLAAQVLGHLVDRVEDLGGGFPRAQGHALEVERGVDDLAVGDPRIALLAQLDLEHGMLGDLPPDAVEPLLHVA